MLIVTSRPCCEREPFEPHKEDCYFKQQRRAMDKFIQNLLKKFEQILEEGEVDG